MGDGKSLRVESLETRNLLAADAALVEELFPTATQDAETVDMSGLEVSILGTETSGIQDASDGQHNAQSDVVLDWNNLFGELLIADAVNQNPGYASRSMAMLNLAIYDAVTIASGNPDGTFYDYALDAESTSNVATDIVASQAAYTVLSSLYPDQQDMIDSFLDSVLTGQETSRVTSASLALGTAIGNQILAERADDGSDDVVEYAFTDELGYFQADPLNPDVSAWGPGWGEVDTFSISSVESFAPETTPALTSEEYAASYNEVLELGSVDSTTRTADQTEAGIFWAYDREGLGTPLALFSDVLETIAVQEGNTLEENATLYAQASVAMADAAIVAWHTKFTEEFWRPVTAIRAGDADGNDLTDGDDDWTPLGAPDDGDDIVGFTPQFPTYISGHATFGGALFGTLQEFYGTDDISFELSSEELEILLDDPELQADYGLYLDDATRSFDSFSEAMAENGRSRVYLGIHFDFDDLVGQEVGQAIAADVADDFVVPTSDAEDSVLRYEIAGRHESDDLIVSVGESRVEIIDARSGAVLASRSTEETSQVHIVDTSRGDTNVSVDFQTDSSALPEGIVIDGGDGRKNVLDLFGTDGADSVVVDGNSITINGTVIEYLNLDSIHWYGAQEDSVTIVADGDASFVEANGDRDPCRHSSHGKHDSREMSDRHGSQRESRGQQASNASRNDVDIVDEVFRQMGAMTLMSPLDLDDFGDNTNAPRHR
ncbi:PAP2 superfamily protein [Planctomycetes bacterium Pan216]|uniref:PAP2 superfamily protein n=1 Tax=Kolteria novifilia TaxID=2527975 RepID=A0A518B302_9BACT|nr:PAP2 superfamily protein [Planctomycetes bacterium Pan216]